MAMLSSQRFSIWKKKIKQKIRSRWAILWETKTTVPLIPTVPHQPLQLCQNCKWVENFHGFMDDSSTLPEYGATIGTTAEILHSDCMFCHMVGHVVVERLTAVNPLMALETYDFVVRYESAEVDMSDTESQSDSDIRLEKSGMEFLLYLRSPFYDARKHDQVQQGVKIILERSSALPILEAKLNIGRLKDLVQTCLFQHHGKCQDSGPEPAENLPIGFRVIDVRRMCIVPAPARIRYVALSYVWGKAPLRLKLRKDNVDALSEPGELVFGAISNTIVDAIKLCQELGEEFLWVDSLCIVQDQDEVKQAQIAAMDRVYSCAIWTICAAAGDDADSGLPGVYTHQREFCIDTRDQGSNGALTPSEDRMIERSYWNSRGWTFQEGELSRRCLVFCGQRVYWKCASTYIEEEAGNFCQIPTNASHNNMINRNRVSDQTANIPWDNWRDNSEDDLIDGGYRSLVEGYTRRQLSIESDIQNAFAGVASMWTAFFNTRLYYELPEKFFEIGLSWNTSRSMPRSCLDLPSWSWTSQVGPVRYYSPIERSLVQFFLLDKNSKAVKVNSGLQHIDDKGWWIGKSGRAWTTETPPEWLPGNMKDELPAIEPRISKVLKPATLIFYSQVIKLKIRVRKRDIRGQMLRLYTKQNEFAGFIEGVKGMDNMAADLGKNGLEDAYDFVGFAASSLIGQMRWSVVGPYAKKNDPLVVAWLVRTDEHGISYRVDVARIFLKIWLLCEPETRCIFLR
ncbi:hypothetical protein BP6252_11099 [Coleophoma cylindrospora]|uniref:Heterokaryon incompatibility domain-containing protein n=1 Tax=Coleophoma cylindrospora TaxID=1849047 RepID=A0A3D8QQ08_9HELO|nr:hypothetical protein BP6252_11099 [Coleophoma cylindrospora]